jgi:hypothetical protein
MFYQAEFIMQHNRLQCQEISIRGAKFRLTGVTTSGSFMSITGGSRSPFGQSPGSDPTTRHGRMTSLTELNLNGLAERPARNFFTP